METKKLRSKQGDFEPSGQGRLGLICSACVLESTHGDLVRECQQVLRLKVEKLDSRMRSTHYFAHGGQHTLRMCSAVI